VPRSGRADAGPRIGRPSVVLLSVALTVALLVAGPAASATPTTASATPQDSCTFDGYVRAAAYVGNTIYLGGDFLNATCHGHTVPRTRLAAIDAATANLLPWAPAADGTVVGLAVDPASNSVYAAGWFRHVSGQARDALARIDAGTGAVGAFRHTITGTSRAVAIGNGRVYLAGKLTRVDAAPIGNIVAFSLATGSVDSGFTASTDDRINALAYSGNRLYLGGVFTTVDGRGDTRRLAALTPDTGALDTTFAANPMAPFEVLGIATGPSGVYAAMGGPGGRTDAYDPAGTMVWQATTDGDVQAVAYLAGMVYIGGHFDNACKTTRVVTVGGRCIDGSVPRGKMMAVEAANGALQDWNPGADGVRGVGCFAANPTRGTLAVGGDWSRLNGVWRPRFAQFNP
jgi:hypothetical protein